MLRFDYDRLREPCLLISEDSAEFADQISELQAAMLRENDIAGVMPAILDTDVDSRRFRCYLRGRQPISRELARSGLTLERYFSILYEITSILVSARSHMLLERNFLLEEEVIFEKDGKPQLVYLPLSVPHTADIGAALLKLAVRWTAYLQDRSDRGVAELLALLQSPGCTAETVNKRLEQFGRSASMEAAAHGSMATSGHAAHGGRFVDFAQPGWSALSAEIGHREDSPASHVEAMAQATAEPDHQRVQQATADAGDGNELSRGQTEMESVESDHALPWWKQRELWVRSALAVVMIVILWQVFWWKPVELMLYGCLGTGVIGILLLFGKLPWTRGKVIVADAEEEGWESFDAVLPEADYYEQLPQQTDILQPDEAEQAGRRNSDGLSHAAATDARSPDTVWMTPGEWTPQPLLILQQETSHADTFHTIHKSGTVVGRSAEADVRIDEPGISAAHLEFLWQHEQGWSVQDLGSRNGTQLNGEFISPYTPISLHVGDRLELPGICCTVKDLNAGKRERYNEREASE
ncbi:FHA domain-containing protein [Xylanibacillus composti]|uniref:FHA domain-containing protein n=1 Tax=Xylanibacillus composti TaxID=1572762 RepID=A0A8J4H3J2_9BACL|nr:FHA domain-containing protein [Xylanibacillus composti]MDT9724224.1 FHA domain-containing protein [Xylanibacillus composti]GIQ68259.1 FHA domain-containing protein [Xylanibacillus composti]